jgi:hypothetical protein
MGLRIMSNLHALLGDAAKRKKLPTVLAYNRIDGLAPVLIYASSSRHFGLDDHLEAVAAVALCLRSERVLQLLQALRSRPFQSPLELLPEEIKPRFSVGHPRPVSSGCSISPAFAVHCFTFTNRSGSAKTGRRDLGRNGRARTERYLERLVATDRGTTLLGNAADAAKKGS